MGSKSIQGSSLWWSSFFHGLFPSGWRLLIPLLLCLPLHLHGGKSPLRVLIEAQRSSLHRSPTSKLPSSFLLHHWPNLLRDCYPMPLRGRLHQVHWLKCKHKTYELWPCNRFMYHKNRHINVHRCNKFIKWSFLLVYNLNCLNSYEEVYEFNRILWI